MKVTRRDARLFLIERREIIPVARTALVVVSFELHRAIVSKHWIKGKARSLGESGPF
jgi:hypothetical protein